MKCKVCGREMTRERKKESGDIWACRNPKCQAGVRKEAETRNGDQ